MSDPLPVRLTFRTGALSARKATRFDLAPDEAQRAALAEEIGVIAIPDLRFSGAIVPSGRSDFALEARLQAQVVQPCVITLVPVATEIDTMVTRRYLADFAEAEEDEAEMPEDDSEEPLPEVIDVGAVMTEALVLALPDYPRAPGAELGETVHAPPGVAPLRDGDLRPFAGLAGLAKKLADEGGSSDGGGAA